MKKYGVFLLLTTIFLTGCVEEENNNVTFQEVTYDKTVSLSNEESSPKCMVSLSLQEATPENGHKAEVINEAVISRLLDQQETSMKHAAEDFAQRYTDSYTEHMLPLYNQDRVDTTKRSWYEYHYVIKASAQKGSKHTVAYLATIDYYEGGAHSINQLLTMNFDSRTGHPLTLSDIFVAGSEERLSKILQKALCSKTGAKDLIELHRMGYLYSMHMFPSENFILGEENITFIYNPYEIAPYEKGGTELIIPYADVDDLLRNSFEY